LTVNGTVSGTLTANGAGIADGGAILTVAGTTTLTAGTGGDIGLGTAGDSFTGVVDIASGRNVTLNDSALLQVNGTVSGNLVATGAGITDGSGTLKVVQTSSLNAAGNGITMNSGSDDFGGAVTVSGANNVTLNNDTFGLAVNGTVGGNLAASGAGISDGGSLLKVLGLTTLTAGAGNNITLATTGDDFAGVVDVVSGFNVSLNDSALLQVNGTVSGTLAATGAGINDGSGTLVVDAASTLSAGGGAITMNSGSDDFGGAVTVNNAANVTLNNDAFGLAVNGTVGGNLAATGVGISDGLAALKVIGSTTLTAGSANI